MDVTTAAAPDLRRSNRWLNAQIGYFLGSLVYFFFLWMAVLAEHYGIFRRDQDPIPRIFVITCTFGHYPPFWYRAVTNAALGHRLQPHLLYLAAVIAAGLFMMLGRPVSSERTPGLRTKVVAWGLFGTAVLMNLWFSVSNLGLRFWRG